VSSRRLVASDSVVCVNERLRTAMLRAGLDAPTLARAVQVDAKTVDRWIRGRTPRLHTRLAVAKILGDTEVNLWPGTRPDQSPGTTSTAEVVGAWAHRAAIPTDLWLALLDAARDRVDLLGYAYPFLFEMAPQVTATIRRKATDGSRIRIAVADPVCTHVAERDTLEQLGGTLPGRIRLALLWLADLDGLVDVTVGMHQIHLYNSVFRFDDQMIVTPHLFRAHGYQHPALHLRRLSPHGIFESFAEQFQQVWDTVRPVSTMGADRGTPDRLLQRSAGSGA
jgi:transcriptional regulator with XRE-family HTH domain